MGMSDAQGSGPSSFWVADEGWQIAWPAAIAFAMLFHGFAFMGATNMPQKKASMPITMAIAVPPPPVIEEPPPPEPDKPKPKPKPRNDLPPPPNETVQPQEVPQEVVPVTGVTADSVVGESTSGMSVRVGNTTFGNPNEEDFVKPQQVQKITAPAFDLAAYRKTVFDIMNKEKRYPRKAQVLGLQGRCLVKLVINRDGTLAEEPKIIGKGTGHDVLDAECIRMAKAKTYPPIVGDVEVPVHMTQPIQFTIGDF
jgi:protein TonB